MEALLDIQPIRIPRPKLLNPMISSYVSNPPVNNQQDDNDNEPELVATISTDQNIARDKSLWALFFFIDFTWLIIKSTIYMYSFYNSTVYCASS